MLLEGLYPRVCGGGGADDLWAGSGRSVSVRGHVCRQDSQGCEAIRPAHGATNQGRAGHQPQDGPRPWAHDAPDAVFSRRTRWAG